MELYKMGFRPTSPTRPITPDCSRSKHLSRFGMWQKLQNLFHRDESLHGMDSDNEDATWLGRLPPTPPKKRETSSARPVGIGLPRQATFKRQNSEKRDRLCLVEPTPNERRAYSSARSGPTIKASSRSKSVPPATSLVTRHSAPAVGNTCAIDDSRQNSFDLGSSETNFNEDSEHPTEYDRVRPPRPASIVSSSGSFQDEEDYQEARDRLNHELDTKWILNLSMHFRDKSDREKFFVTYAETPTHWRRVTVSCDYRHAEPGSLEMDLKELQLQRDKSLQIYEAVRESLADIKFYDTVTNLKLETTNGRLHVHVTEDVNEIIPYPPITSLNHIFRETDGQLKQIRESELSFEAHLSGFVYKVSFENKPYIKKEIPGPDTVDEFLYEVNALHSLNDSRYVIDLEAIITDESGQIIKGLLINYAERGAVVDLLYDYKGEIVWEDRERWARHAIQGLSDVHEEGYVQGDFTLSNIVVDDNNNAQIIDINRRGCPVGWEPPEIAKKIASNQRISMYIGQKSDLYQLGMTLWALAMDDDEPERHDPPLSTQEFPSEVPLWYQEIVRVCLSPRPRDRLSATDLIKMFPPMNHNISLPSRNRPVVRIRTEKQYIDPSAAVERDDIERFGHATPQLNRLEYSPESSRDDPTFTWPQSSNYDRDYDSTSSEIERPRGRRRISDHDEELRAHRRSIGRYDETPAADVLHDDAAPIISISSDGTETHILDGRDGPVDELFAAEAGPSRNSLTNSNFLDHPPRMDRLLFPNHSETSDDTARHGSLQLFGSTQHSSDNFTTRPYPVTMADELTNIGTHHTMSEHSFDHYDHRDPREVMDDLISPLPALTFADSGYDSAFGIEPDFDYISDGGKKSDNVERSGTYHDLGNHADENWEDLLISHHEQEANTNVTNDRVAEDMLPSETQAERSTGQEPETKLDVELQGQVYDSAKMPSAKSQDLDPDSRPEYSTVETRLSPMVDEDLLKSQLTAPTVLEENSTEPMQMDTGEKESNVTSVSGLADADAPE